ncbi:uncharacterized protein LOC128953292 [Oppia nitens]|uniref:uncharacterized protein LOC128953292 n=1 Tax=Oppia nitens TaxID=1686743 RepID=UPI0023DA8393|nr:uncharacterized protein LOC128953292 [Oppia nitens]
MHSYIELVAIFISTLSVCKYLISKLNFNNNIKFDTNNNNSKLKLHLSTKLNYNKSDWNNKHYFPSDETQDKFDFRRKTSKLWEQLTVDQMLPIIETNIQVLQTMMRLQGLKYKAQGIDYMGKVYDRLIQLANDRLVVAYGAIDGQSSAAGDDDRQRRMNYYAIGASGEEYRFVAQKLDVRRKNRLTTVRVADEPVLLAKFSDLQRDILARVVWAGDYVQKKGNIFYGDVHKQLHQLIADIFKQINNDLDQMASGIIKTQTIQILIEEFSIMMI